eukprot:g744.t1
MMQSYRDYMERQMAVRGGRCHGCAQKQMERDAAAPPPPAFLRGFSRSIIPQTSIRLLDCARCTRVDFAAIEIAVLASNRFSPCNTSSFFRLLCPSLVVLILQFPSGETYICTLLVVHLSVLVNYLLSHKIVFGGSHSRARNAHDCGLVRDGEALEEELLRSFLTVIETVNSNEASAAEGHIIGGQVFLSLGPNPS